MGTHSQRPFSGVVSLASAVAMVLVEATKGNLYQTGIDMQSKFDLGSCISRIMRAPSNAVMDSVWYQVHCVFVFHS